MNMEAKRESENIKLPEPKLAGEISLEEAFVLRKSVRRYKEEPIELHKVSQLLWAGAGLTRDNRRKAAPSAGGTYPLSLYLVAGNVAGISSGVYKFSKSQNEITLIFTGDTREELCIAAQGQLSVKNAPASIVVAAYFERTTHRYRDRGVRYVHQESGHVAQNIALQAVALGLGTVMVGAYDDDEVSDLLSLPAEEEPLYIIPVGIPSD